MSDEASAALQELGLDPCIYSTYMNARASTHIYCINLSPKADTQWCQVGASLQSRHGPRKRES